jgi:hypothetical protein
MRSPTTYGLVVLLLASLGLNARLWTTRGASPPVKGRTPATSASAPSSRAEPDTCERRLQACQMQSWQIAQRVIAADHPPRPAGTAAPTTGGSDHPAQASALCNRAKQSLKETWQRDRDAIAFGLAQSLVDKEEQERNVVANAAKMAEVAGLDKREAAAVETAYREKRLARVAQAQSALGKQPPDFNAMLDAARGLLADEDSILEKVSGSGASDAWRADQVEGRSTILALVATLADKDWDESISW